MRTLKAIRRFFELVLVQIGLVLAPLFPRALVLGLARLLGLAGYYLASGSRRIGLANLDLAFGDTKSPEEKRAILRQSWQSFALMILDSFWFTRWTKKRIDKWFLSDESMELVTNPRPQIWVTGHFGNWELFGISVAYQGYPLTSVAAPLINPAVDIVFNRMRKITGQAVVPREGAVKRLIDVLRAGGKVAILKDQNTKPSEGGIFVNFFERPVVVSKAAASLALRLNVEIAIGFCPVGRDGRYTGRISTLIDPGPFQKLPRKQAIHDLTQRITLELEKGIRRQPASWLWSYKRWKYIPADRDSAGFPYYARRLSSTSASPPE